MSNQAYDLPLASVGKNVVIYPTAKILGAEHLSIGDYVVIDDQTFLAVGPGSRIGEHSHLAAGSSVIGGGELTLGSFSGWSTGVRIITASDAFDGSALLGPVPDRFRNVNRSHVRLGDHVVIGANSVVLPGVTLADGVAVGAMSLVRDDLPEWTICVGNPARPVKDRPRETMLALQSELKREEAEAQAPGIPVAETRAKRP